MVLVVVLVVPVVVLVVVVLRFRCWCWWWGRLDRTGQDRTGQDCPSRRHSIGLGGEGAADNRDRHGSAGQKYSAEYSGTSYSAHADRESPQGITTGHRFRIIWYLHVLAIIIFPMILPVYLELQTEECP